MSVINLMQGDCLERIQELAEQAGWKTDRMSAVNAFAQEQKLEKFAELIVRECEKVVAGKKANGSAHRTRKTDQKDYKQTKTGYPKSILEFKSESKPVHPTQKPVALMEYLIRTYTNEGETVLDFTMGSGTTGVACVNTNRKFIGIELDEGYFEIAKDRIAKTQGVHND